MGDRATAAEGAARTASRDIALPRLRGRAALAFRFLWLTAFVLTVVAMAVGNYRSYVRSTDRPFSHVGLGWYEANGEIRLREPFGPEAVAAGIRRGDAIVAVDGKSVGTALEWSGELDRRLKGPEGSKVVLAVRGADGTVQVQTLTRTRRNVDAAFAGSGLSADAYSWIRTVAGVLPDLFVVLAAVLLFRGRREEPVGALLSLSLLLTTATGGGAWSFWQSAMLVELRNLLAGAGVIGLVAALLAFPAGRIDRRLGLAILLAAIAWTVAASFLPPSPLNGLVWLALMLAAVGLIARRHRHLPDGRERQQIRWAMLGFAWGTILLLASGAFGTAERFLDDREPLDVWLSVGELVIATFGIICFVGGLLVSLLRFRLYDVDSVISRSAAYGLLTAGFVAVFAGSQKVIESLGENFLVGGSGPVSGGIAAAIGAAAVVPLHNRMHGWAERRFQKALLHLRRDLPECVEDLRETAGRQQIVEEVLSRVAAGVRASRAAMIVGRKVEGSFGASVAEVKEWRRRAGPDASVASLDCDPADPLFPMRVPLRARHAPGPEPLGWLLLGPRPDGSFYGTDEREALAEVADPVARALRVVQLRDEREAKLTRLVEERMAELERRLAGPGAAAAAAE